MNAGIRKAGPGDLDAIAGLLRPLEEAGTLVRRSREDLANLIQVCLCEDWVDLIYRCAYVRIGWI